MSASVVASPTGEGDELDLFVDKLAGALRNRSGGVLTWLNHYTALQGLRAGVPLDQFDYLGLDGIFLCRIVKAKVCRTSADLVLPRLLERSDGLRIALIGSTPETVQAVAAKIEAEYGHRVVVVADGYDGLPQPEALRPRLRAAGVHLAVVGLGAPRQDMYALALRTPGLLVATCGGWLDQFVGGEYYPAWAYPLRLNWLVRLAKEPRRLWRRYSVDAVRALRVSRELTEYVTGLGGKPLSAADVARPEPARPAA